MPLIMFVEPLPCKTDNDTANDRFNKYFPIMTIFKVPEINDDDQHRHSSSTWASINLQEIDSSLLINTFKETTNPFPIFQAEKDSFKIIEQ